MKIINHLHMNYGMIHQFQHETETWKRLLEFLQAENVFLKTRLGQITKEDLDNQLLEQSEYFQNQFIREDEMIGLMRHEVSEQDSWLAREVFEDGAIVKEVTRRQKRLRREIEIAEQKFNKLKFEFNNYLSEHL
jgi:hypothetical protein